MIVREIKTMRDTVLANFDWFNDYDDTRSWALRNCDGETVLLMDKLFKRWLARQQRLRIT